jgi:hypothetical protein
VTNGGYIAYRIIRSPSHVSFVLSLMLNVTSNSILCVTFTYTVTRGWALLLNPDILTAPSSFNCQSSAPAILCNTYATPTRVCTGAKKAPITFVMSVRLSACISAVPTRRISITFQIGDFNENLSRKSQFGYNRAKYRVHYMKTLVSFIVAGDIKLP